MQTFSLGIYNIIVTVDEDNLGAITSSLLESIEDCSPEYISAINTVESIILAHACAGIDVSRKEYVAGIQTALDTIENIYGE